MIAIAINSRENQEDSLCWTSDLSYSVARWTLIVMAEWNGRHYTIKIIILSILEIYKDVDLNEV